MICKVNWMDVGLTGDSIVSTRPIEWIDKIWVWRFTRSEVGEGGLVDAGD